MAEALPRLIPNADGGLILIIRHRQGSDRSKHWFDVDDGRAIDDFDGADAQPVLGDLPHGDGMKA